jgi:hypothetical protein
MVDFFLKTFPIVGKPQLITLHLLLHSSDSADRGRSIVRVIDGTDRSVLKQSHDYEDFSATSDEWRVNEA